MRNQYIERKMLGQLLQHYKRKLKFYIFKTYSKLSVLLLQILWRAKLVYGYKRLDSNLFLIFLKQYRTHNSPFFLARKKVFKYKTLYWLNI